MESSDVVIAGAGIIGLSLALDLATRGLKVTVLDRGRAMAESSWAAAGMLAARDPENPPQLAPLADLSLTLYPDYLSRIEQLSNRKVPRRTKATIQALPDGHDTSRPSSIRKLTPAEAQALEPDLQPLHEKLLLIEEQSLDPRDLCLALPTAAKAAGVTILEDNPVISIDANDAEVVIRTSATAITATHFVNCAGAWAESPALGRLPPGHPKIAPRKGQMASVRLRGRETLTHVLRTPDIYLVPRGDGTVVVGATVEHVGFDKTIQPHAIASLLKTAAQLWPPIAFAEILETWTGLRPGSADELPLIGLTAHPNTWVAAGHFRNGILLAPGTARALAQLILGESPEIDLTPFNPARTAPPNPRPLDRLVPAASDNRSTAAL